MSMRDLYASSFIKEIKVKRILLPIFNRATYSRCKSIIDQISRDESLDLTVLLCSSLLWEEYGSACGYIDKNHKKVRTIHLPVENRGSTHLGICLTSADILIKLATHIDAEKPDAVIVVADRFETMPAAMAACYQNIPLIHIQGGEVTNNIDDRIRHAITKLSDYHFVSTRLSKRYVLAMGEEEDRIFYTGCPSIDLIKELRLSCHSVAAMNKDPYILCIFHPETEHSEDAFSQTEIVLKAVLEYCLEFGHVCYWYYPNPDPGREDIVLLLNRACKEFSGVIMKAVNDPPDKFLSRLAKARMIVGNSSSGLREASYLGIPSVNIGSRQGYRERSWNVIDIDCDAVEIGIALRYQHKSRRYSQSHLYGSGDAAKFMVKYLCKLLFTLKGTLTYPKKGQYRDLHIGANRFGEHHKIKKGSNGQSVKRGENGIEPGTSETKTDNP